MRTADGIDTHRLEFREFAMEGIFVEGGTQAAKVVMLADAIEFEVLAIEPKARLGIEAEGAEACRSLVSINHLTTHFHLRAYLIYMWCLTRPKHRLGDGNGGFQAF